MKLKDIKVGQIVADKFGNEYKVIIVGNYTVKLFCEKNCQTCSC